MKNIIITGAAGMVGSELLETLIKDKNKMFYCFDNLSNGKKKFLTPYVKEKNFKFFKANLETRIPIKIIKKIKGNIDELWLLAANSDIQKGNSNYLVDYEYTFKTTVNTLKSFENKINNNSTIIFSSSSAIYGKSKKKITEKNLEFSPESNYGLMKLLSENFLNYYQKEKKFFLRIYRFPNVVGKNLTHGIIFDFRKKMLSKNRVFNVLGNGTQKKPYSHTQDIIRSMIFLNKKKLKKIVVNLGYGDNGIKVSKIVDLFFNIHKINKKIKYQNKSYGWRGDVTKYKYSINYLNSLGFKFSLNSINSLKLSINNIKK